MQKSLTFPRVGISQLRFQFALLLAGALAPMLAAAAAPPARPPRAPGDRSAHATQPALRAALFAQPQLRPVKLPLQFEPNRGQWPGPIQYVARLGGMGVQLVQRGANFAWLAPAHRQRRSLRVVRLRFVGAKRGHWRGRRRQPSRANEFLASSRTWRRDLPLYAAVRDRALYPGIAAQFQGRQGLMEWSLRLAPGANPRMVRMRFQGGMPRLAADGSLRVVARGESLRWFRPRAWQSRRGRRQPVEVSYAMRPNGLIGFRLGAYDPHRPLVIDPSLAWASYLGGLQNDQATAVATDSAGDIYVTGSTLSANFPSTSGAFATTAAGNNDVFVSELNPAGTALIYSSYLGGSGDDQAAGIVVDAQGDAIIAGSTNSTNFPTTSGALASAAPGGYNTFVSALAPNGASLIYSTYLGGSGDDRGTGLALDGLNDVYISGYTASSDFPVTSGVVQPKLAGLANAFVSELNPAGSALVYSTYLGGSGADHATAIALDSSGDAYIAGFTDSPNFPITSAAFQTSLLGKYDAFVAEILPGGAALDYATYLGGSQDDEADALAVDSIGNVYVSGYTLSSDFPITQGAFQVAKSYNKDIFVTKLSSGGASLDYSTFIGGSGNDIANGIALDQQGYAYLTGWTDSSNFPVSIGTLQPQSGGNDDAFLLRLDPIGAIVPYSTYLGGTGVDQGNAIALDSQGNVILAGTTFSSNFPVSGALQPANAGLADAFIVKFQTGPSGGFSASALTFPQQAEFTTSQPLAVNFYNSGEAPLDITQIEASKDFTETNNCPAVLAVSTSCSISVNFTPSVTTSPDAGSLTVDDNAPGGSQSLPLSGTVGTFSIVSSPTQATVNPGNAADYNLTLTPANGYVSTMTLACGGLPAGAACTFTPASVTLSGDSSVTSTSTMAITTTLGSLLPPWFFSQPSPQQPWLLIAGLLAFLAILALAWRQRASRRWLGLAALACLCLAAAGCGSNSTVASTRAGSYNVTVSATDSNGKLVQSATVSLVVID